MSDEMNDVSKCCQGDCQKAFHVLCWELFCRICVVLCLGVWCIVCERCYKLNRWWKEFLSHCVVYCF